MPRFLHVSDIHLGFDRYDSKERTLDFYHAFRDALHQYAIAPQVDFVVLGGDLFEHRHIQPNILNQAQLCLQDLQEAGIPVLAIEGNHDNTPYGTKTSWLRYLSDWGLLKLLEPSTPNTGHALYEPWDEDTRRGGYIDLACGVRVLGSYWYGASAPNAIASLAKAIKTLPPPPAHTVMLFHHGLEGQIARYQGALRYNDLLPLKEAGVDYLALGHIHKNYTLEGWIFNPGSVEYKQRSIVRLKVTARGQESQEELEAAAIATVQQALTSGKIRPAAAPIVELKIEGQVGFDRLELDTRTLQQHLQELTGALIFLLRYNVDTVEYATHITEEASRFQVEHEVFMDLLVAHNTYKKRAPTLAQGLIDLKAQQLQGHSEGDLYQFVQSLLQED
jgi:DNA repair protein SbcD/Mre11